MKKKTTIVVTIIAIIVLAIAVWFFGYHNRKSNDNLPSLTSIAQMDEAEFNKIVCGYRREQLVEVWGSPDESSSTEDTLYKQSTKQTSYNELKDDFAYLGVIESDITNLQNNSNGNTSDGIPKENFQANHPIVRAKVYQYGNDIVVEIEGKYWLYEQLAVSSIPAELYTDDGAGTLDSDAEE